ncbi:ATP-dependent zinc metalloprotease FtsH [Anaerosalibacter bizertensis]|uniref:ATP-dependent zinc metalloprotease FtsH n=1 Tax=Anaerosalibacter bizertensis TaxID=932217 RepID=A0A9Q4FM76_9FIRM|nr:ATP-dependent zinc metalloprotease FtsH [Anaerosalibacter bizertensis]MBU5293820.1 ATP-dependent zinc metalloprotease FtsH [Anaerosalibacter bizertensis]MCG4565390.1 ATP-dependent zinc metalloprotease FtsH [Anaerosalibacter bizertensis]MCG4582955.1 ATP-dependent zinc metalloprotease FtsH [Anaerosalibacter bizertensis]HHV26743.1 ATP-dependent zinc metalloprotease FtsH [Tissierellia bacterium]
MKGKKRFDKKKGLLYYLLIMLTINFIFNGYLKQKFIQNVSYSEFVKLGEEGKIVSVEVDNDEIIFEVKSENKKSGKLYKANNMKDPELVGKLEEWGVEEYTARSQKVSIAQYLLTSWVIPIIIIMMIWNFISRSISKRMGGNVMNFGEKVGTIYAENEANITFDDVAGQDEAKESLKEIVDFIKNQEKYTKIGAKLPKGALLVGPPGTGKTLLAKAIAGEAKVPFFSISGSEFVQMFVGMGASRVRDLFKQAQEKSPCIVFIDEIDAIGKKRDSGGIGGNDEREQTLNQLLTEMDGFDSSNGVVILAATNRPEVLDPALLRPGRFDRRIIVDIPDLNGRIKILEVHSKDIKLGPDVNLEDIAKVTPGAAGSDLANIVNEAALRAVRFGRNEVMQEDLMESIETVIAGAEKKDRIMSQKEKEAVAYHEAGHAIVAAMLEGTDPVAKITIVPRTMGSLGYTLQLPEREKYLISKEDLQNELSILFGGRSAEEVKFDLVSTGASNDIEKATEIARNMVTRYGMSEKFGMMGLETASGQYLDGGTNKNYSETTGKEIDDEVLKLIKNAHETAKKILKDNIELLDSVARKLLEVETISGEEFNAMVEEYKSKNI